MESLLDWPSTLIPSENFSLHKCWFNIYQPSPPLQFPSNPLWGGVDNIFAFGVHNKSKASEDKFKSIVGLGPSQLTNKILDNSLPNLSGVQRGITKYFIQ